MAEKRKQLRALSGLEPRVNVLLVDDRPDNLLTLEAVLDSSEYNLIKAQSGPEAISRLSADDFAVILLDVQMPGMDGFQTATLIKQNSAWKDIPILFVTAVHKDTPYIYQGYGVGAVDYIFKPFDPHILRSKVAVFAELYRRNRRIVQAQEELRSKEEELYQARKLEAIGRLAGGVAHDFNNIVAGIRGITEELRESMEATDTRREDLNQIIEATHRAFSLTRQLLAYARRQVISPVVLDVNDVIMGMKDMLIRLIGEDMKLTTELDGALGAVKTDRGYLEQVLVNLVLNARDAMKDGGTVTIRTLNSDLTESTIKHNKLHVAPGSYVLISVTDTGAGMTQDVKDHMFEPFFTTKEKDKGTGLGLATVYGIVKQNGGDIVVRSQPMCGTRMDIYLPRVAEEVTVVLPEEPGSGSLARGSETILVAEDENLVRRIVVSLLKRRGYQVLEAASGPEALSVAASHGGPIHLLITDVVMPEMNGRQLADALTAKDPKVRVLFMSGYPQDIIANHGIMEPGIHFIEKSAISRELGYKVYELLKNAVGSSQSSERPVAASDSPASSLQS